MRVLFSCLANAGHTFPLLPLATAARDAGHDVIFATGTDMHDPLRAGGFEPVTAGCSIGEAAVAAAEERFGFEPAELDPEQRLELGPEIFGNILPRRFLDDLEPLLEEYAPEAVIYDSANNGVELAARRSGTPALAHGLGPWVREGFEQHRQTLERFTALHGIPAAEARPPYFDIYPDSLQDKEFTENERRIALRPVPFGDSGELPDVVTETEEPLVYLTYGTGFGTPDSLHAAAEALAALPVRVLVATGPSVDPEALGELPERVTAVSWVPQAKVLEHASLVVHHGGSGTTLAALGAAVPQVVLPLGADQFANSDAVSDSGAGRCLHPAELTGENLRAMAGEVLESQTARTASARLAAEIAAMPAPETVARRLGELIQN